MRAKEYSIHGSDALKVVYSTKHSICDSDIKTSGVAS